MGFQGLRGLSESFLTSARAARSAKTIGALYLLINVRIDSLKSLTFGMLVARPRMRTLGPEIVVSGPGDIGRLTIGFSEQTRDIVTDMRAEIVKKKGGSFFQTS